MAKGISTNIGIDTSGSVEVTQSEVVEPTTTTFSFSESYDYNNLDGLSVFYNGTCMRRVAGVPANAGEYRAIDNGVASTDIEISAVPPANSLYKMMYFKSAVSAGGGSSETKWQRKDLTSAFTTTGEVTDVTFNNLTIGNTYNVSGKVKVESVSSTTSQQRAIVKIVNGGDIVVLEFRYDASSQTKFIQDHQSFSMTFIATNTKLHMNMDTRILLNLGAGSPSAYTFMLLEELPNHTETTDFT